MNDENVISKPTDVLALGAEVYINSEIEKKLETVPKEVRSLFHNHAFESAFWKRVEDRPTPLDYTEEREGPKDRETGQPIILEYFPEEYTQEEMSRLFPGWWDEGMKHTYYPELRTIILEGYLCAEYPTFKGLKTTKRYAIVGLEIEWNKEKTAPSQPGYRFRSIRAYWLKAAGKHYGIGLDCYHQKITPQLRKMFEDRIRDWGIYAEHAKKVSATFDTGHGFRNYLKEIPTIEQTERIRLALTKIPHEALTKSNESLHDKIWKNFVMLRNDSATNREKTETFIQSIEATAVKYEQNKEA